MNEDVASPGWFADVDHTDAEAAATRIRTGEAETPEAWPAIAVETGTVSDEQAYYDALRAATLRAARDAVTERERADDRQLIHAVRSMDDCDRVANELAERLTEWAGSLDDEAGAGVEYARQIAGADDHEPQLVSLAERIVDLAEEAEELRTFIERRAPDVAPNLAALAGPVLAARLISLAGDLESLAKKPSGTVQVLGAEDALFAHLRGHGTSPKHGVIFTHEYVRGTDPDERGSAARALAGKLSIAARIDYYSGEYNAELEAELDRRIERIRTRGDAE
ncbi:NOP5/NOP56 family protein [Natranaeroarchaeum aerophilus]|uniref:NOP58 family protein n=1 Tax=Natranaeroarchaeum aerophilus TaxID=2917711 RepID=A0AAE3FQF2_9EURY|nr:NOP5/NOP56 family protein [Natranaeroarchaeum aerophilus]MCL9813742.1 NOP58 family protein [Natranaeroarchaeum aerophilus]